MKNIIIVFERPDINPALTLQSKLDNSDVWVFDPHLIDDLVAAGVQRYKYIECELGVNMPLFVGNGRTAALSIEHAVETDLQIAVPDAVDCYWQHLNWHFIQSTLQGYTRLWDRFLETSFDETHFHILVQDAPATYYTPSFLPAVMLMERMSARRIEFSGYAHSSVENIPRLIPAQLNNHPGNFDYFTHLPTCIYDSNYYAAEIAAMSQKVLNFESQNWNVSFPVFENAGLRNDTAVLNELAPLLAQSIELATEAIETRLTNYFLAHVRTEMYARRQAAHMAKQYRAEMIFFHFLEHAFSTCLPRKIILSNHDAGLHGPFLSFAKKHAVPVLMLPHAKIFNFPIPSSYPNIVALTHPIQGGAISTVEGKRVNASTISFPESLSQSASPPKPLNQVGLLLNKFSGDGMTLVDTQNYLTGIRAIIDWCAQHSVSLKIRVKPGGTCIHWLANELDLKLEDLFASVQVTIVNFAHECDICIMYDAPTSGAISFLQNSIPILSTVIRYLCAEEANIISTEIVQRASVAETLEWLERFKRDSASLALFRTQQFGRYAGHFSQSIPLRMFL